MTVLRGVAAALKFLHEDFDSDHTILHRDIKTRNVMMDGKLNGRLGDFGLARFCDRSSTYNTAHQSQQLIGTQGYMAPEYLDQGATVGTDVFSFGVMILVVATGR
jgi:serine/threonine protein kinase